MHRRYEDSTNMDCTLTEPSQLIGVREGEGGFSLLVVPAQLIIAAAEGSRAAAGVNMDLTEREFL